MCLVVIVEACWEAVKEVWGGPSCRLDVLDVCRLAERAFVIVDALCHGPPVLPVLLAE